MSFDGKDYEILYDNGHREEYGAKEVARMVLSPELEQARVGSRITVLWDDGKYHEATITHERNKKRPLFLEYDDGDTDWTDLRRHKFRRIY